MQKYPSEIPPPPRLVSSALSPDEKHAQPLWTFMFMMFGQFLDHDMNLTPPSRATRSCCRGEDDPEGRCFAIDIPEDQIDTFGRSCMHMTRCDINYAPDRFIRTSDFESHRTRLVH